jgi:hypothetical protein
MALAFLALLTTLKTVEAGHLADPGLRPHPRLQIDRGLLDQIRSLREAGDPAWARFSKWIGSRPKGGKESHLLASYLLASLVSEDKRYFEAGWEIAKSRLYRNGAGPSGGLTRLIDLYKGDQHQAAFKGGQLIAQMALVYDWGYGRLTPEQRQDLIGWLNDAVAYEYLENRPAHSYFRNDGASATYGLAAAVYATLGENPEAAKQLAWFRSTWKEILKALDIIGKGGASGEGNAYGAAPTASSLIRTANLVYYASGEDLFVSHVWFKQRLLYDAFAAYPGTIGGPGSAVPDGWPGNPIVEQASIGGDGRRGASWHSANLRPNGLILSRRFAGTQEADIWNWVYRQPTVDRVNDASESICDLLYYSPKPSLVKPARLSFFDPSMGFVYIRSDWDSPDATWIAFWAGPHIDTHQHLDQGAFTIFKRRDLAPKTGHYDADDVKSPHDLAYYTRTVSSNGILIGDPSEIFRGFIAGMGCDGKGKGTLISGLCIPNDGGQRTMAPLGMAAGNADFFNQHRDVLDVARVVSFRDDGQSVSWVADITNAYSKKVTKVYRRFVYLREPDVLLIGDTVESANPAFQKKWLIHALDRLEVGTDEAKIIVDDTEPSHKNQKTCDMRSGYAALLVKTLFPVQFRYIKIGGREPTDLPPYHRHIQDFWVKDFNEGVIPNHKSFNWAPQKPIETYAKAYSSVFGPGYGRWRLEIDPATASRTDFFLNVLKPTLEANEKLPPITRIETADTFGAALLKYRVVFSKESLEAPRVDRTAP